MTLPSISAFLSRPAEKRRLLFLDLGRLSVFVFGVLVVTGALLALYYQPSADGAFGSLVNVTNSVHTGWFVRSLHRVAGHVMIALVGIYILRGYFKRLFLGPRGPAAWRISVGFGFVCLAFLLTGEALPWNQASYWQTVVNTNLISEIPLVGGWLAEAVRGGPQVSGVTLVRLYALHALLLPWAAFGLLVLARDLRRRGDLA
jgi:quinol-cytochrome oxidoreductase complex cytochrome b subunit